MPVIKATLWTLAVLGAVGLATYFAGCSGDGGKVDSGPDEWLPEPCRVTGMKIGDQCHFGVCIENK